MERPRFWAKRERGLGRDRGRSGLLVSEERSLGRERHGSRPCERLREPRQHHKISVKLDTLQAADTQGRKSVLVLEPPELPLAPAEVAALLPGRWRRDVD